MKVLEVYAPNPSLHESPEIAAVCPYCHPERMAAKTKQAKVEAVQALKAELQAGRGILDAIGVAATRIEPLYCTTGELPRVSGGLRVSPGSLRAAGGPVHLTTGELPTRRWRGGGGGGTSST